MDQVIDSFILENGGERLSDKTWRLQTPKRVVGMERTGDLLVSSLAIIKHHPPYISCSLPLGEVPGQEAGALISDLVDIPGRVEGRAALLVQPTDEGSVVLSLGSSFYLQKSWQGEKSIVEGVLLSLLDALADTVAETMARSDVAFRNGQKTLSFFLRDQAGMSIVLEQAKKRSGTVSLESADFAKEEFDLGKIQQELYDFTANLNEKERARLDALTEKLRKKDPLTMTEAVFQEELHNVPSYPRIEKAKELTRAENDPYMIAIYGEISCPGPIDYHYAWVVYDLENSGDDQPWHSEDLSVYDVCLMLTLESSQSGTYIGLFTDDEHTIISEVEEDLTLDDFKKIATPIAKKFLSKYPSN